MSQVSEAALSSLQSGLEKILDVAFDLRSVPEDEIPRWLAGSSIVNERRHLGSVKYCGQPVHGIVKEYAMQVSGEQYRLVVHPCVQCRVVTNEVKVRFTRTYAVGKNQYAGEPAKIEGKNVLYLLPLVAKLPVSNISFDSVQEFFEKNNGFVHDYMRFEMTRFRDVYKQTRRCAPAEPIELRDASGKIVSQKLQQTEEVLMDVYVTVHRQQDRKVKVDLEIHVPRKIV
ncbi:MAG: hypothetical protein QW165_03555 [Candidatus Woesearchaeota archaeon]